MEFNPAYKHEEEEATYDGKLVYRQGGRYFIERKPPTPDEPAVINLLEPFELLEYLAEDTELLVDSIVEEPEWVIKPWWPAEAKGIIYGLPKTFKSTFAHELAFSIAYGHPFLGLRTTDNQPCFPVTQHHRGNVLILQEEMTRLETKRVMAAIYDRSGMREENTGEDGEVVDVNWPGRLVLQPQFAFDNTRGRDFGIANVHHPRIDLLDAKWLDALLRYVEKHDVKYAVFDTAYKFVGAHPLKEEETAQQLTARLDLLADVGCTPVLIHHTAKDGTTAYGSVFLTGWYQVGWWISEMGDNEGLLEVDFQFRNMPRQSSIILKAIDNGVWEDVTALVPRDSRGHKRPQDLATSERRNRIQGLMLVNPEFKELVETNQSEAARWLRDKGETAQEGTLRNDIRKLLAG